MLWHILILARSFLPGSIPSKMESHRPAKKLRPEPEDTAANSEEGQGQTAANAQTFLKPTLDTLPSDVLSIILSHTDHVSLVCNLRGVANAFSALTRACARSVNSCQSCPARVEQQMWSAKPLALEQSNAACACPRIVHAAVIDVRPLLLLRPVVLFFLLFGDYGARLLCALSLVCVTPVS